MYWLIPLLECFRKRISIQGSIFKLSRESERWYPVWLDASKWSLVVFKTKLCESVDMPQIKLCQMVLLGSDQGWTGMDSDGQ